MLKMRWKPFLISLGITLATGVVSAFLTNGSMEVFQQLKQPPLSPPGWLFPVVWTILFTLMGIAAYQIYIASVPKAEKSAALIVYGVQLMVNFLWPIFFFLQGWYLFAFFWLLMLWVLILGLILLFYRISKWAGLLLIPYLLWVAFAGYLNFGVYLLN